MQKSRKRDKRTPEGSRLSGGFLCCTNFTRPTGNLDSQTELDVVSLLKSCVQEFGQTLVMITHDEAIAQMADRIIEIEDGRIGGAKK